jgi:hypothetical protein
MYVIRQISVSSKISLYDQGVDVEMVMLDLELGKSSLLIGTNCRSNGKRAASVSCRNR